MKRFVTHLAVMAQYKSEEFKIDRENCHICEIVRNNWLNYKGEKNGRKYDRSNRQQL